MSAELAKIGSGTDKKQRIQTNKQTPEEQRLQRPLCSSERWSTWMVLSSTVSLHVCQFTACQLKNIKDGILTVSHVTWGHTTSQLNANYSLLPDRQYDVKDSIMVQTFEILDHQENRSRSSSWYYHHLRDSARSRRWSQFSEFPRSIWKWKNHFGIQISKNRSYKNVTNAKLVETIHFLLN